MDIRPIDAKKTKAVIACELRDVEGFGKYAEGKRAGLLLAKSIVCNPQRTPTLSLNTLRDEIYQDAVAHGLFEEFDKITDPVRKRRKLAMRIMEEAAEMYAAADDPEHYAEEAADVTLMTGDVCGYLGIDWHKAVMDKKAYNTTRPWKHGRVEI